MYNLGQHTYRDETSPVGYFLAPAYSGVFSLPVTENKRKAIINNLMAQVQILNTKIFLPK
jgi:hypothetical protein